MNAVQRMSSRLFLGFSAIASGFRIIGLAGRSSTDENRQDLSSDLADDWRVLCGDGYTVQMDFADAYRRAKSIVDGNQVHSEPVKQAG